MINIDRLIRKTNIEKDLDKTIDLIKANILLLIKEGNDVKIKAEIFEI